MMQDRKVAPATSCAIARAVFAAVLSVMPLTLGRPGFAFAATAGAPASTPPKAAKKSTSVALRPSELVLSLADAVFIGLRKNPSIRSAYAVRAAQKFDLLVAEDVFTPHAVLGATAVTQKSGGSSTNSVELAPQVEWVTPLGTVFNFSWNNAASRSTGAGSQSSVASVGFTQPLLRGAGVEVNTAPVRSARLSEDLNRLHLKGTVSDTITTIVVAYRALLRAQEAKAIADSSLKRSNDLVDVDQQLIQAGRMAPVEIVQVQADVENQRIAVLQAENTLNSARFALAALLDLDVATPIRARDSLQPAQTSLLVDNALTIAFAQRPDYLAQTIAVEQARLGVLVADNGLLWDLSLYGNGSLGRSGSESHSQTAGSKVVNGSLGVQLNIPINDLHPGQAALHASTSLADAQLQLKMVRQTVEQQIRTSVTAIDLSWRQLETARRARTLATDAVEIEKEKLNAGRSTNFQVQSLENNLRAAESQQLDAAIDYLNALSTLDLQLGTTLDTWKVSLSGE